MNDLVPIALAMSPACEPGQARLAATLAYVAGEPKLSSPRGSGIAQFLTPLLSRWIKQNAEKRNIALPAGGDGGGRGLASGGADRSRLSKE